MLHDAAKRRRTYVMIIDIARRAANTESLEKWLKSGWEIVEVESFDYQQGEIAVSVTVETDSAPVKKDGVRGRRADGGGVCRNSYFPDAD